MARPFNRLAPGLLFASAGHTDRLATISSEDFPSHWSFSWRSCCRCKASSRPPHKITPPCLISLGAASDPSAGPSPFAEILTGGPTVRSSPGILATKAGASSYRDRRTARTLPAGRRNRPRGPERRHQPRGNDPARGQQRDLSPLDARRILDHELGQYRIRTTRSARIAHQCPRGAADRQRTTG